MPGHGIVHVCVFVFCACVKNHSLHSVSEGHGAGARRPTSEAGLCLMEGICFLFGLYMVAPRSAEGGRAQCGRSQLGDGTRASEGREIRGRDFGVRNASEHQ